MVTEKSILLELAAMLDVEVYENDTLDTFRRDIIEALDRLLYMKECRDKDWLTARKRVKQWRSTAKKNFRIMMQS